MPELNDSTLWDYMTGFYGTGDYSAPTWFIGIEEGGGEDIDEIIGRCAVWEDRGRRELDDLFLFHTAVRPYQTPERQKTPRYGAGATVAPTWRKLICLLFAIEGTFPDDKQERDRRLLA